MVHFSVDGFLQRLTPDAAQTTGRVPGLLEIRIVLDDDGVLHEEGVDVDDVERSLKAQLVTGRVGFRTHLTATTAALVRHAETASSLKLILGNKK